MSSDIWDISSLKHAIGKVQPLYLMPCPFCGGEADFEAVEQSMGGGWSVGCSDEDGHCFGYQSLQTFARKCEAAVAWNRRSPAPVVDAVKQGDA